MYVLLQWLYKLGGIIQAVRQGRPRKHAERWNSANKINEFVFLIARLLNEGS